MNASSLLGRCATRIDTRAEQRLDVARAILFASPSVSIEKQFTWPESTSGRSQSMRIHLALQGDIDEADMSTTEQWPQYRHGIPYSDRSKLNTLQYCLPRPTSKDDGQIWVIYIHGGAWNDADIDAASFNKAQDLLLSAPEAAGVAGFASINYRLSPSSTDERDAPGPPNPSRSAKHPDHINDVLTALLHLQTTFHFADRYILVGHSCGAMLALQVAMKRTWAASPPTSSSSTAVAAAAPDELRHVVPPLAILGVEGLYDLPALVRHHRAEAMYRRFVTLAFGADESAWAAVSPARADFGEGWPGGRLVVLAHSRGDELVEWEQVELQHRAFRSQGWDAEAAAAAAAAAPPARRVMLLEVEGKHDEVWRDGRELARAVRVTVGEVLKLL